MNIDLNKYIANKTAGLVGIAKINNAYAIAGKRFDASSGAEIAPEVVAISKDDIIARKVVIESQLANLEALIADLDALDKS